MGECVLFSTMEKKQSSECWLLWTLYCANMEHTLHLAHRRRFVRGGAVQNRVWCECCSAFGTILHRMQLEKGHCNEKVNTTKKSRCAFQERAYTCLGHSRTNSIKMKVCSLMPFEIKNPRMKSWTNETWRHHYNLPKFWYDALTWKLYIHLQHHTTKDKYLVFF
jgi:hypothetical protein